MDGYLKVCVIHSYHSERMIGFVVLCYCIVCGRSRFVPSLMSINCHFSSSLLLAKTRGELSFLSSPWPVAHLYGMSLAPTVRVGTYDLGVVPKFIGVGLEYCD